MLRLALLIVLVCCGFAQAEPTNLLESIPVGASPNVEQRALLREFAAATNHVQATYDASGNVVGLELSNHGEWIARHKLGESRPGLSNAQFGRLAELQKLAALRVLHQPVSDEAYAVLGKLPALVDFRVESHRTDAAAGRSHRFMLHIHQCPNLRALELKHLFGLKGTSVDQLIALPKLEYQELDNDSAGPEALVFLAKCPNLTEFELHRTSLSDEQIGQLVELLPKLRRFVLKPQPGSTVLTAGCLSHLQRHKQLEVVGLHQWRAADSLPWENGLEHLLGVKTLKAVEFPGCKLTLDSPSVKRLREARPEVQLKGLP